MLTSLVHKHVLCLGWSLPAMVVVVSVGFTHNKEYGATSYCWLSLEGGLLCAFVGSTAVVVLVNMLIGIIILNKLMAQDSISNNSKKQRIQPGPGMPRLTSGAPVWCRPCWHTHECLPLLTMTNYHSALFQALFTVFNSVPSPRCNSSCAETFRMW